MIDFYKLLKNILFPGGSNARYSVPRETQIKIRQDWNYIDDLLVQKGPSQLRQALITADKTLDNALRDITPGDGMAERLKSAQNRFDITTYNKVWEAHKMRNNLVHEAGYEPPHFMLVRAVGDLRRGLKCLGVDL